MNDEKDLVDSTEGAEIPENPSIPSTPLEPSIPSQPSRPSIPVVPAEPSLSPEEEIKKRKEDIEKLKDLIMLHEERIMELSRNLYADKIKEIVKESSHYYDGPNKMYVFRTPEQVTLMRNIQNFLENMDADVIYSDNIISYLNFFSIPYEFYGKDKTLYISLDPLCLCGKCDKQ